MSFPDPPSTDSGRAGPPAGDLDSLLRTFLQAEMPRPGRLPPCRAGRRPPVTASPRSQRRVTFFDRSAGQLAAAVWRWPRPWRGLMVGTLLLSGRFQANSPTNPRSLPEIGDPKYQMREFLEQPVVEKIGADGKPVRQGNPTKYVIEFFDQLSP